MWWNITIPSARLAVRPCPPRNFRSTLAKTDHRDLFLETSQVLFSTDLKPNHEYWGCWDNWSQKVWRNFTIYIKTCKNDLLCHGKSKQNWYFTNPKLQRTTDIFWIKVTCWFQVQKGKRQICISPKKITATVTCCTKQVWATLHHYKSWQTSTKSGAPNRRALYNRVWQNVC